MTTALITHADFLTHVTPEGHPECVARLQAVLAALADRDLLRREAPVASEADILRVHPDAHLAAIRDAVPSRGLVPLDGDTFLSPGSFTAAMRAAGGAVRAVDLVLGGQAGNAFVACRPPGHHAEASTPMGFCLFGTVAIAAKYALDVCGLRRVAIVDFDVHHGNGTQDLVQDDPRVFFCSTHQMPLYPGTGAPSETGVSGNVLNLPLPQGAGSGEFRHLLEDIALPAVQRFAPEFLFVSAGFDAHRADPLAGLNFTTADFAWATEALCDVADACCGGRIVSCLEGGYDLGALADSAAAHVDVLIRRGAP